MPMKVDDGKGAAPLISGTQKETLARILKETHGIGWVGGKDANYASLQQVCVILTSSYVTIRSVIGSSVVQLSREEANEALLAASLSFMHSLKRYELSIRDFLTDVEEILERARLTAVLRELT